MKKLSVIRGDTIAKCPYGLKILTACETVGDVILSMNSINDSEDPQQTSKANLITYYTQKTGERCPFANEILSKFDKVDCSWGDTAAGEGVHYLTPSPLYPRTFISDGLESGSNKGQDIYDPRLFFDAPERYIDVPFGLFSIFASRYNELGIIRIAEKYTNKTIDIRNKLALLKDEYFDTLKLIASNNSIIKLNDRELEQLLFIIDDWVE